MKHITNATKMKTSIADLNFFFFLGNSRKIQDSPALETSQQHTDQIFGMKTLHNDDDGAGPLIMVVSTGRRNT